MSMMMLLALAQTAGAAATTPQLNPLQRALGGIGQTPIPMLLMIFAVFYLLVIRPQQTKQKEHEAWQKRVGVGDEIVTSGGLVGKITHATEELVTVEVGDKVRVRVLRSHITGPAPGAKAAAKDAAKDEPKSDAKNKASA